MIIMHRTYGNAGWNFNSLRLLSILMIPGVQALECFSCVSQEDNNEKCISTIQLCDPEIHDACSTNIRWGVPFFWVPAIKRMHYISKSCDNMRSCQTRKRQLEDRCYRDWWADWQCEDCCSGDRCNHYVVLASVRSGLDCWLLLICIILPLTKQLRLSRTI